MQELETKLNHIVGAAIRALVESGADDGQIGAFAVAHRTKVAAILGASDQPVAGPPDLVELVRGAVRSVLSESGLAPAEAKTKAKRINVLVAGKRTSVTVDAALFFKVAESNGGPAKATALIKDLASSSPSDVAKRSGWIEEKLMAIMEAGAGAPTGRTH